jgi:hypothetical protein
MDWSERDQSNEGAKRASHTAADVTDEALLRAAGNAATPTNVTCHSPGMTCTANEAASHAAEAVTDEALLRAAGNAAGQPNPTGHDWCFNTVFPFNKC